MRMTVARCVGQRIRDRRDEMDMTQEEFGRRIGRWLGKPWSRSTVSVAENGRRAFTAAEIAAIAHVLDVNPPRLFIPPYGVTELEMPSGAALPVHDLNVSVDCPVNDLLRADLLRAALEDCGEAIGAHERAAQALRRLADRLS